MPDGAGPSKVPDPRRVSVAVVGAGVSGITAAKHALEEGFETTCFEQHDQIGE